MNPWLLFALIYPWTVIAWVFATMSNQDRRDFWPFLVWPVSLIWAIWANGRDK